MTIAGFLTGILTILFIIGAVIGLNILGVIGIITAIIVTILFVLHKLVIQLPHLLYLKITGKK